MALVPHAFPSAQLLFDDLERRKSEHCMRQYGIRDAGAGGRSDTDKASLSLGATDRRRSLLPTAERRGQTGSASAVLAHRRCAQYARNMPIEERRRVNTAETGREGKNEGSAGGLDG